MEKKSSKMPDNALISDNCLLILAKDGRLLHDIVTLLQFLKFWSQCIFIYRNEILLYLQKNFSRFNAFLDPTIIQSTKAK